MRNRLVLVLVLALGLVAASCSSDRSEPPSAEKAPAAKQAESTTFGTMPSPCGSGSATGATDQGVTAGAIHIGYGDDAGFSNSPGLNHEMSDAVKAFVAWCNDQGGINGRRVDATYYDAKITEVNNVMTAACPKEFFLVGQGFALDASQEVMRRGCGLPSVPGFAVSPQHSNAPLKFEPVPVPGDYTLAAHGHMLKELFPGKIGHAAVLFANYSATIDSKDKVVPAFSSLGYDFRCQVQYNILGESDWKPLVQRLKDCGAEMVYWVGSPLPNLRNVLDAAAQLDFRPIWWADPNTYDRAFARANTDGFADNVYFLSLFTPLEEAKDNRATQQYLDVLDQYGGDPALLGQQSASAFLLWATAAKACGDELTRTCVLDHLKDTHAWTAGGFQAESDPGANVPPTCAALLKVTGTHFERVKSKQPNTFSCDPSYAFKVTGAPVERAKIGPDRIAQL